MEKIRNDLREALTGEILAEIIKKTGEAMNASYKQLSERAAGMADVRTYQQLLDYCYQQTEQYLDNRDNMKKVLVDANNIPSAYHSMTETEEFRQICTEEYRGFPRVILMTVLAGSESHAAAAAAQYFEDNGADRNLVDYEDQLCAVYQKYLKDAISYGKGEDKKVVFTGEKN